MHSGWIRTTLGLAVALGVVAVPLPGDEAAASCVAPYLEIGGREGRPALLPGAEVRVEGRAFVIGCDDTGTSTVWGCSVDEPEQERPMQDIELRIRQQGRVWALGSTDAGTVEHNRLGHASWKVTLPAGVRPGRATLAADGAEPLRIRVLPRRGS